MNMITFIIGVIVFSLLTIVLLQLKKYFDIVNREFKPNEKIIGNKENKEKALVLYCPSLHDSVDVVKNCIVEKLYEKGYTVFSNFPSTEFRYNLDEFEVICFISPVYMRNVSRQLSEVMVSSDFRRKKVLIISVGKEMSVKKELEYMKNLLNKDNKFNLLKTTKEEKRKIENFVCGAIL